MDKKSETEMEMNEKIEIKKINSISDQNKNFAECSDNFIDHLVPIENLIDSLSSSAEKGLNSDQVLKNREKYGINILKSNKKRFGHVILLLKATFLGLNLLLWVCAIISFASYAAQFLYAEDIDPDNLYLGISLIFVCTLSGIFSFYQEFKSNKIMNSFKKLLPHRTNVLRNGLIEEISVENVVVGDIVQIQYGELIPADCRIIESQNFKVDNSCLTGESEPQNRSSNVGQSDSESFISANNLAFFSTSAIEGTAKCIVIRVGSETVMGQVANLTSKLDSGKSPISIEIDNLIVIMTIRSLFFGGFFLIVALSMHYSISDSIFFVIGITIANIPESLTVFFTLILGAVAKKMAKKNCLVKNLQSVETLGSTSVICSDKTGTITQNKMSVSHLYFNGQLFVMDTNEVDTWNNLSCHFFDQIGFLELYRVAVLSSKATFKNGQDQLPIMKREITGDATEKALLKCMEIQRPNVEQFRAQFIKKLDIPFNSRDKFCASVYEDNEEYFVVFKGAPEKIISLCTTIFLKREEKLLDSEIRAELDLICHQLCGNGERVLGFCQGRLPKNIFSPGYNFSADHDVQFLFENLQFIGLISMIDPPRAAVPNAVQKCRQAGIKVVMVTGDHPITAKAIASSVGILTNETYTLEQIRKMSNKDEIKSIVITGPELTQMSDLEITFLIKNHEEIVFARTSPEQKYKIVEAFQSLGHIVAVTGDGVNDCPALKRAEIGIVLGLSGTEVAKNSGDMILMDDDFSSILVGIEEGRRIFDNLKKLLCYSFADNIAEMYCVMFFIVFRIPLPMGSIAMILNTLVTDTAPAISIAFETAENDILKLPPRNPKKDKLVTKQLLSYTYGQTGVIEMTAGFFSYFLTLGFYGFLPHTVLGIRSKWEAKSINDLEDSYGQEWTYSGRHKVGLAAQTSFFIAILSMQVVNIIICKTRRLSIFQKGMRNWALNWSIPIAVGIAAFLTYTPVLNRGLDLHPVKFECWLYPLPFMAIWFIFDELRRFAIRSNKSESFFRQEFYP